MLEGAMIIATLPKEQIVKAPGSLQSHDYDARLGLGGRCHHELIVHAWVASLGCCGCCFNSRVHIGVWRGTALLVAQSFIFLPARTPVLQLVGVAGAVGGAESGVPRVDGNEPPFMGLISQPSKDTGGGHMMS